MSQHIHNSEMRLWLLGTGTPEPSLNRASSGYVIQVNSDFIIFDHGFGSYHRLMQLGIPVTNITHVFLSHYHFDHIGDLPRLYLTHWDQGAGNVPNLNIYGPKPLYEIINRNFSENGVYGPDLIARTNAKSSLDVYYSRGGVGIRELPKPNLTELKDGDKVNGKDWTVKVIEGSHQQPYLTPLGYRIEHGDQSIVYSGDTAPKKELEAFAKDTDVLIAMCHVLSEKETVNTDVMGHLEVAELARNAKVKTLVLTHMSEKVFDKPGIREKVISEIAEIFKGEIYFGEDLMEISLPKKIQKQNNS
jgi:ribonuclease Z